MKVAVADLHPNPYRNMKHYPIDAEKVTRLAQSIKDTTFWDNILGRRNSDGVQIAYGHHRLKALQKVMRDGTVDIPVRPLTDEQMLKIMANENGEEWGGQTSADLETIRTVRQYLVDHPEVADAIGKFKYSPTGLPGAITIAKFLGGIWTVDKVNAVLELVVPVEKGEVDEEAIRSIKTTDRARMFVQTARTQPKAIQRKIAEDFQAGKADRETVRAITARYTQLRTPAQPPKEALEEHLVEVARQARLLNGYLNQHVFPHKRLVLKYGLTSFEGVRDLNMLYQTMRLFFEIDMAGFRALTRGGSK
jgi:ParB-like chromosome segregation protein Spo0J